MRNEIDSDSEDKDQENTDGNEMHFIDHLEEFRWVIIRCVLALVVGCVGVGVFLTFAAGFLARPLEIATEKLGVDMGGLVTISPMGAFTVLLQVCFLGGIALALPFVLYFVAQFLAPGLTKKERTVLFPGCLLGVLLFLLGACFAYFFILPLSIIVSLKFNQILGLEIVWSASAYYNFVVWMILAIGGSFEFPLVLLLLQYVEIVTPKMLRGARHIVIVIILVSSAVITPSDPVSMMILAGPLYLLYELSILTGESVLKKKRHSEEEEDRKGMEV